MKDFREKTYDLIYKHTNVRKDRLFNCLSNADYSKYQMKSIQEKMVA